MFKILSLYFFFFFLFSTADVAIIFGCLEFMAIAVLMEKCKQLKMWQEMFYNTCKVRSPHTAQYTEWENRYLPLHTHVSSSKISICGLIDLRN